MSWNYRVLRIQGDKIADVQLEDTYCIIEVYYGDAGEIKGWTGAVRPRGDDVEDLKKCFELMLGALDRPVLVEDGDNKLIEHTVTA